MYEYKHTTFNEKIYRYRVYVLKLKCVFSCCRCRCPYSKYHGHVKYMYHFFISTKLNKHNSEYIHTI